jgi:hypothetical protein
MDVLQHAESMVRPPWWARLTDRTFISMVTTAVGAAGAAVATWRTEGVSIDSKVQVTIGAFVAIAAVVGSWNHSEKKKDAAVSTAAINASNPSVADCLPPLGAVESVDFEAVAKGIVGTELAKIGVVDRRVDRKTVADIPDMLPIDREVVL